MNTIFREIVPVTQNGDPDQSQQILGFWTDPNKPDQVKRLCESGPNLVPDVDPLVDEVGNPRLMQREQCNPTSMTDFKQGDKISFSWILRPNGPGYLTYVIAATVPDA